MMQMILRGAVLLAVGVLAAGCSQNKFWAAHLPWKRSQAELAEDPADRTLPDSRGPSAALSRDASIRGPLALARLSERRGQPDQAERVYQAVIEKEPQNPVPYHRLGVLRARDGKFQEADEYFTKALELDPSNPDLLSDVGYAFYLEHRPKEAEEVLRRALELKPRDAAISNNLGSLLGEQGRDREALAMFRRTGTQAQAHANLAFVYVQQGEFEKAKENYSRALTLDHGLRPAAEALAQLAEYEDVYQRPPTESEEPLLAEFQEPPALELVERPLVDVTAETTLPDAGELQAMEPETQHAAYLVDEPQSGVVVAGDLAPSSSSEREHTAAGGEGHPPAIAPEPSQEEPDVWDRLGGAVSEPSQPSGY